MSIKPAKLTKLREMAGLSRKQLAKKLKVSEVTVGRWENGKNTPDPLSLGRIEKIFEVSREKKRPTQVNREASTTIGEALRRAREVSGMTIRDLEAKTGIPGPTLSRIESGKIKNPRAEKIEIIETILGNLVGATPSKTSPQKEQNLTTKVDISSWLGIAMAERRLTPRTLATKSGLSLDAIKRIQSGKTQNLQSKTRSRLEKVLGKMPHAVVVEAEQDSQVVGLGQLEDFDPHSVEDRPDHPGIYVFYDISERPIYVGKGGNIKSRIRDHEEKFWFKRPIVESASSIKIEDEKLRGQVEQVLIKFLKSNAVINKQGVIRND